MNLDRALDLLAHNPSAALDVAELALQLARDEYPDLDVEACLGELDAMAHETQPLMRGDLAARVTGLCRYLFHEMGFHGNKREYYDPRNSYLNQVLERRTGLPITLSALTMAVGARAGLMVVGVGLPGHFIAKVVEGNEEILLDPFHGGRRLTPVDCENLVRQVTGLDFEATPQNLEATPLGLMVQRLLQNLKGIYLKEQDFVRAIRVIRRLRQLDPHNSGLHRDLGTCYFRAGLPGKAIKHLVTYLAVNPGEANAQAVQDLLKEAKRLVSAWN